MKDFLQKLDQNELNNYVKLGLLSSIDNPHISKAIIQKSYKSLTENDLIKFCIHSKYQQLKPIIKQIKNFKLKDGNNCLHIASKYGNLDVVKNFLKDQIISTNQVNKNHETPLIYTIKNNPGYKFQKIVNELIKYTDLKVKDNQNKMAFQLQLPITSPSRVRIMEFLKSKTLQ